MSKLKNLHFLLDTVKNDIILVTESWLTKNVPDSILTGNFPYNLFRSHRNSLQV
jgi:hypothetical protein